MKILLLGGNGFGKVHAESYQRLKREFSVFDRKESVLKFYEDNFNVANTFSNLENALNSTYDVVDIVLPHNLHYYSALKAINRKKHVILEKPIATNLTDATSLITASRESHVKFMVAEQYFFDSSIRLVRDLLSKGIIGKVKTVIVRDQRFYKNQGWRINESMMGGGALIDGGIHYIETILDIGGEYSQILAHVYKGGSQLEGEDNAIALFSFASGSHGILFYSWSYNYPPILPSYEIIGTNGSIVEDVNSKPKVDFKFQNFPRHAFGFPILNGSLKTIAVDDIFDSEIESFLRSIEEDIEVPYRPELAMRNLDTVLRIYGKQLGLKK